MPPHPLDQLRSTQEDPCLRPTEKLVSREADDVGAGREALGGRRLVADREERTRAEVVDERQAGGARKLCQLRQRRLLGEPDNAKVRLVHTQNQCGLRAERALVVCDSSPVRGADLDEPCTRPGQHLRDPEAVADLDQLSAGDQYVAPFRERREGEHHGRRVVVDDERRFGTGDPAEQPGEMILSRSSGALLEVVLEVRVAASHLDDARERGLRERRPTEVRVDEHAGRVEDAPERRSCRRRDLLQRQPDRVTGIAAGADLFAGSLESGARGSECLRTGDAGKARIRQDAIDRGQRAE